MIPTVAVTERSETYTRYLDAAEQAFIRFGYEGASIRRISADAGAPLGTLHHYWGSKDVLFRAVCERRFEAIQVEQLRRLRLAEPDVESVARALVEPPLLAGEGDRRAQEAIRLLYGRVLTEPSDVVKRIVKEMFRESTRLFRDHLQAACPALDAESFYWRMTCALGAFIFAQSFGDRVAYAIEGAGPCEDWRCATNEIVGFIVRGMGPGGKPIATGA